MHRGYRIHALKLMHCVIVEISFADNLSPFRYNSREMSNPLCPPATRARKVLVKMSGTALVLKTKKENHDSSQPRKLAGTSASGVFSGSAGVLMLCAVLQE